MNVRKGFRDFTRRVADTVDELSQLYDFSDIGYDTVTVDPGLRGTSVGGYFGVTPQGSSVLAVSPDQTLNREVADHEASHSLLPPNLINGLYTRFKGWLGNVSTVLAEADVMRNMVDVHKYKLDEIRGYDLIKDGLLRLGREVADAAGGAKRLYEITRNSAQQGLTDLINSRSDIRKAFGEFFERYDSETLKRYGMLTQQPNIVPIRVRYR